jgi:hypothetical protein
MINSREAYEQKDRVRKTAREAHLENELEHTQNRLKHLEDHIIERADVAVTPPVMLDTDATAAWLKSQKESHAEYKHICFGFYWKKK